jgi:hypothetical protein
MALGGVAVGVLLSGVAGASVITISTPTDTAFSGLPVKAFAQFTTAADELTVVLGNLQADPRGVVQCLSGLLISLSSGQTSGALTWSQGTPRWVQKSGAYTDDPVADTGWQVSTTSSQLYLHVLGVEAGPAFTLLGPPATSGSYDDANNSITGNSAHNPFLAEQATYRISIPGLTAEANVTVATFVFGTASGNDVTVPEPATAAMLALGAGVAVLHRRRRAV